MEGYTGGSWYTNKGAGVDTLCLPRDPEWGNYRDGTDGHKAYVFGAEYQTYDSLGNLRKLHDHDVPCAVCFRRNRSVVRMFPGASDLNLFNNYTTKYIIFFCFIQLGHKVNPKPFFNLQSKAYSYI